MSDDSEAAVKVAVRVRPFNGREKASNAKLCIDMSYKTTTVYEGDVEDEENPKPFTFDYSLWSHYPMGKIPAGPPPDRPDRPNVDQQWLYDTIGNPLLDDLWQGYDVCMFAYGQSGSGKSFSMTGSGPKCEPAMQGMIPRLCRGVFERAVATTDENISFDIKASMLEIYNAKIYDLLIREGYNVKTRPELDMKMDDVDGLRWLPVANTDDVSELLVLGFGNQYKAPTGLNVDSSRGHTIYTLRIEKTIKNPLAKKKKDRSQTLVTGMKLVDLAGSERTEKVLEITKAQLAALLNEKYKLTGDRQITITDEAMNVYRTERTTEGRAINTALTNLGQCVKQVAQFSSIENDAERNKKMGQIAWRASPLTRLLRNALNGKCKTLMIAAISPSFTEYPETISTMRYANNIKMIKSCAVKKVATETEEQKMARRIKELEEQLQKALAEGGGGGGGDAAPAAGPADPEVLKQLEELKQAESLAKQREAEMQAEMEKLRANHAEHKKAKEGPHVVALLPSELSDGMYVTPILPGADVVAAHASLNTKLALHGVGVSRSKNHCVLVNENGEISLIPEPGAAIMINGSNIKDATKIKLNHNDRIRLGGNNYFRLIIPAVMSTLSNEQIEADELQYTFDFAKEESMKEIFAAFGAEEDKEAEEKRKKAVAEELAKHEAEFRKQQEATQKKVEAERKAFEEQMRKLQSEFESNANQDKEMLAQIAKEKEMFEKRMRENEMMLKAKLEEEERYKQEKLKEEERLAKKRASAKAKLQYDLMDAIPFVRSCNEWAAELKVPVTYEVKIVQEDTPEGSEMVVSVQLRDTITGKVEVWDMDTFRTQYGQIMQDYHDNVKNIKEGKPIRLSHNSPFRVNDNAVTTIGSANVLLNYLFYNMELNDKFHIVSHDGHVQGSIHVKIAPVWADEEQEDEVLEAESLYDVPSLKYLDLDITISKCEAIPPQFSTNVTVDFAFPEFIQTSVVDLEEAKLRKRAKELKAMKKSRGMDDDDFFDESDEEEDDVRLSVRGAKFQTEPDYKGHDDINVNPPIEWSKRIRVHQVNKRVIEWFKDSSIGFKVKGRGPSKDRESALVGTSGSSAAATVAATPEAPATYNGKTAQELADEVEALRAERNNLAKALEEAKKAAQSAVDSTVSIAEARSNALMEALEQGKVNADNELRAEVERLKAEHARLKQEAIDKRIALERLVQGNELGSVRNRIKDVSLPETLAQKVKDAVLPEQPASSDKAPVIDQKAIDAAVAKARAELEAKLDEQRKLFEAERKRAQRAEADLQIFKAEFSGDTSSSNKTSSNKTATPEDPQSTDAPEKGRSGGKKGGKRAEKGNSSKSSTCTVM